MRTPLHHCAAVVLRHRIAAECAVGLVVRGVAHLKRDAVLAPTAELDGVNDGTAIKPHKSQIDKERDDSQANGLEANHPRYHDKHHTRK